MFSEIMFISNGVIETIETNKSTIIAASRIIFVFHNHGNGIYYNYTPPNPSQIFNHSLWKDSCICILLIISDSYVFLIFNTEQQEYWM